MKANLIAKVLLIVLAVLLLGSIACSQKPDPRDATIERLNSREDQLIAMLIQQNGDLKAERFAFSTSLQESINAQMEMSNVTTVMTERYISHLEVEESQLRKTLTIIATNPPDLQVANSLIDQNQELQNSLVELISIRQSQQRDSNSIPINQILPTNWDWRWPKTPSGNRLPPYQWEDGVVGSF